MHMTLEASLYVFTCCCGEKKIITYALFVRVKKRLQVNYKYNCNI